MRYRGIDPLTRLAGILWAAFSLITAGIGVWVVWKVFSDTPGTDNAKNIWGGLVLLVMGGISTAFGLALAFEREPRKTLIDPRWTGILTNTKGISFFLGFSMAGLLMLSGMLMPGAIPRSAGGVVVSLGIFAAGTGGLWVIFKKRRKQRERSLKSAQQVAGARAKRLAAKQKRP